MLRRFRDTYRYVPLLSPAYRALRRHVRQLRYSGTGVRCNICQREFARWVGGIDNGTCPYCNSFARHRLLWLLLHQDGACRLPQPCRLLYFAPDPCLERPLRAMPGMRCVTTDLTGSDVDVRADITRLPFPNDVFDALICCHVLEHIQDDAAAMREMHRVLKPGGQALIQVPIPESVRTDEDPTVTDPYEREARFGQFDHVRRYGPDIADRLQAAGFQVSMVRPAVEIDPAVAQRLGLWDDAICDCRKLIRTQAATVEIEATPPASSGEPTTANAARSRL